MTRPLPDVAIEIERRLREILPEWEPIEDLSVTDDLGEASIDVTLRHVETDGTIRDVQISVEAMSIEFAWQRLERLLGPRDA